MWVECSERQRNIAPERVKFRWHFNKNYPDSFYSVDLLRVPLVAVTPKKTPMYLLVFILLKQRWSNSGALAAKENEAMVLFSPSLAAGLKLNYELVEQT